MPKSVRASPARCASGMKTSAGPPHLHAAFEKWWNDAQPLFVNENVAGPTMNPFKESYG